MAVWVQTENSVSSIWASTYTPDGGWIPATLLETSNLGNANAPQVKWDAAGNAMAIWQQYDGRFLSIYSARFTPDGSWSAPVLVEQLDTPNAIDPQIAFDPAGNGMAVWRAQKVIGGRYSAWANRYTPLAGWGSPELLESDDSGNVEPVQVAMDTDGNAFAVWHQGIRGRPRTLASRFTPANGWEGATLIEDSPLGFPRGVQVAADATGHAVAVWLGNTGVQANRYVPGTGWGAHTALETIGSNVSDLPQLAINAGGHAVVVWSQTTATIKNILASSFSPTTGWLAAPVLVGNQDIEKAEDPRVGIDAQGNAIAVWRQTVGTTVVNIWEARYTQAGGWAAASQTDTGDTTQVVIDPTVRVAPSGTAVIGWGRNVSGVITQRTRFFQ